MNSASLRRIAAATALALIAGCGGQEYRSTPTSGSACICTASAALALSRELGRSFEAQYTEARIDFAPIPVHAAIESLYAGSRQEIILDRPLAPAESLACAEGGIPLYQYRIATLPLYFAVNAVNTTQAIDSVALRRFLSGSWSNWSEAGGPDLACRIYAPRPGEGGWEQCVDYFESLDMGAAVICSTQTELIARAEADPGALAIVSVPIARTALRKLWWRTGAIEIPPTIKTIAEEPRYPFRIAITYVTSRQKMDVAAGFLTYIVSNSGQKIVADLGYRPAAVPVRIIETF